MTVLAPAARALTMSPENLIPPSAIIGTEYFLAAVEQFIIAVNCGTPTPAIILVVHMLPGPMPTLTASLPALISSIVAAAVATFPATKQKLKDFLNAELIFFYSFNNFQTVSMCCIYN